MYAIEPARADSPARQHEPPALRCRAARADDAEACAPLIFASGVREFGFFLGEPTDVCIRFLAFAFASKLGRFSYRRHRVAVTEDDRPVAVLALHDGRNTWLDDPHVALMLLRFFGPCRTVRMLLRGLVLEGELPAPKKSQTLIAHCATDERLRGTGVFSALFADAMSTNAGANVPGDAAHDERDRRQQLVLDVLVTNKRAYALYQRLGFVELPRRRPVSTRLPAELESVRMEWVRKN